jgi:hypothetical protein
VVLHPAGVLAGVEREVRRGPEALGAVHLSLATWEKHREARIGEGMATYAETMKLRVVRLEVSAPLVCGQ